MRVRVLGCSGAIARDCKTTSFLIDQDTLIDAGTGVGDLPLEAGEAVPIVGASCVHHLGGVAAHLFQEGEGTHYVSPWGVMSLCVVQTVVPMDSQAPLMSRSRPATSSRAGRLLCRLA